MFGRLQCLVVISFALIALIIAEPAGINPNGQAGPAKSIPNGPSGLDPNSQTVPLNPNSQPGAPAALNPNQPGAAKSSDGQAGPAGLNPYNQTEQLRQNLTSNANVSADNNKINLPRQNYDLPPSPTPTPPPQPTPGPGRTPPLGPGPGGPGFPGIPGLGFSKNLNINALAGYLPFLGGLGFGGPGLGAPPVDGGEPVPPGGPGFGGPGFGGGFMGPSYLPATWLGSALGAKGDILFPLVVVVFFIVGVWAVINFLLAIIVPIIAGKIGVVKGVGAMKMHKVRSAENQTRDCRQEQVELVNQVMQALKKKY